MAKVSFYTNSNSRKFRIGKLSIIFNLKCIYYKRKSKLTIVKSSKISTEGVCGLSSKFGRFIDSWNFFGRFIRVLMINDFGR